MNQILIDIWRFIKIRAVYPYKKGFSRIASLLPKSVEPLVQPYTVVERDVEMNDDITYLGVGVFIGEGTRLYHCSSVGNYTSISQNVKVGLQAHPKHHMSTSPLFYSPRRGLVSEKKFNEGYKNTVIGHDVLISANVLVLAGVKIGNGAIIGAGTLVRQDVPPYSIVVGVPGKVIGWRFEKEIISNIMESQWWNLPAEELKELVLKDISTGLSYFSLR